MVSTLIRYPVTGGTEGRGGGTGSPAVPRHPGHGTPHGPEAGTPEMWPPGPVEGEGARDGRVRAAEGAGGPPEPDGGCEQDRSRAVASCGRTCDVWYG